MFIHFRCHCVLCDINVIKAISSLWFQLTTIADTWRTAYELLGQNKDLSPKQLYYNGTCISTPEKLATVFDEINLNKVRKLKKDIPDETAVNPIERLRKWLNKRNSPVSEFDLHTINQNDL